MLTDPNRRATMLRWAAWAAALVLPVLVTVALKALGPGHPREYTFIYLALVAAIAATAGPWPAMLAAVTSFLLIDFYFVLPLYTLTISRGEDVLNLALLLGAAGVVGALSAMRQNAQRRAEQLAGRLQAANLELERLNQAQAVAAQVELRLAVTEQQVRALEESDRARRDFLANVSHDIRTPIATILTASTAALDDVALGEGSRAMLQSAAEEARRLNAVVADMLDMSRIEGNALDLQLEPVDLALAIDSAVQRLHRTSPGRSVEFARPASAVLVQADWGRLGQVLDNLLGNADREAPPGTAIKVVIGPDGNGELATTRVIDQGPGIPKELGDRVFERFVRGSSSGGTGLGLAIVRGLVEAQAGRVWLDGDGPGTTVAFTLPLAEGAKS